MIIYATKTPQHPGLRPAGGAGPGGGLVLLLPGEEGGARSAILRHPAGLDALHVHVGQQVQGAPRIWKVQFVGGGLGDRQSSQNDSRFKISSDCAIIGG